MDESSPAEYQYKELEHRRTATGPRPAPRHDEHHHADHGSRDGEPARGRRGTVDQPPGPPLGLQPWCSPSRPACGGDYLLGVVNHPGREQPPADHTRIGHAEIVTDMVH